MANEFIIRHGLYVEGPTGIIAKITPSGLFLYDSSGNSTFTVLSSTGGDLVYKQIITPINPTLGYDKLYFKNDDKLYTLDSLGNEVQVGAGGGIQTFTTVASAELASGVDNDLCYVVETETFYRYEATGGAYTRDGLYILNTNDGGTTRWLGVSGNYTITGPVTTKGDLYTYSTAHARLPIGTNQQVLVVDSTTSTGLKWEGVYQKTATPAITIETTVDSFADTLAFAGTWNYLIHDGTNFRSGQLMGVWTTSTGSTPVYTEAHTNDIGDTSAVTFKVDKSSNTVRLQCIPTSGTWTCIIKRLLIA